MNDTSKSSGDIKSNARGLFHSVLDYLKRLFDLQKGVDKEGTILYIQNNKSMMGANVWMLICSIAIASLGLDLNSPAIIIGAMLISPLMSPILGVGLAIGTNDRKTLGISMRNFGTMIIISLLVSFIYFWLNPLGRYEPTREILVRTGPTLLDGLVAIFGGIAGIISVSRKDQSNAIPGVAIATALMPPLCVSGYGLANMIAYGDWKIFLDSFYLFFLNSFFIAISTFVLIRYMKFPIRQYQNKSEGRRTAWLITIFSVVLVLPSIFILRDVVQKNRQEQMVSKFVKDFFGEDKNPSSIEHKYTETDTASLLVIKLLGKNLEDDDIRNYERELAKRGVVNPRIIAMQGEQTDLSVYEKMSDNLNSYQTMIDQFTKQQEQVSEADRAIATLQRRLDSLARDTLPIMRMNQQVSSLLPDVQQLSYGHVYAPTEYGLQRRTHVFVHWAPSTRLLNREEDKRRLALYLQGESNGEDIYIFDAPE